MCCLVYLVRDQFSGIGLAQQVVLAVMLDNDLSLPTNRLLLSILAIGGAGDGAVCVFVGVAALLSGDIMFINNNQCNNDNHYQ